MRNKKNLITLALGILLLSMISVHASCVDFDGEDIFTKSYVMDTFHFYFDSCTDSNNVLEQTCSEGTRIVKEFYCGDDSTSYYCNGDNLYVSYGEPFCSDGKCSSSITNEFVRNCDYGCSNGTCLNYIHPDSCTETNSSTIWNMYYGAYTTYDSKKVSGYLNGEYYSYTDYCLGYDTIMHYSCSGNYTQAPVETDIYTNEVYSNEVCGKYNFTGGEESDVLFRTRTYQYCSGTGNLSSIATLTNYNPSDTALSCYYGCENSQCNSQPTSCAGNSSTNKYIRENVSGIVNGTLKTFTDFCRLNPLSSSPGDLYQYYCDSSNNVAVTNAPQCLYDCGDGVCKKSISCTDTDGGLNYSIKGSVSIISESLKTFNYPEDHCSTNGTKLIEYSCNMNNNLHIEEHSCNCVNGTCI